MGPLLFNIYINYLVRIGTQTAHVIDADDTSLLFSPDDDEKLAQDANDTLRELYKWSNVKFLHINISKAKAVLFKPKNKSIVFTYKLKLGPSIIELFPVGKTFGAIFQENLSWDFYIKS